jgi:modification methylase
LAPKANAYGDVWEFPQEMNNEHPAPFPVALIERIISSTTAQVVLDPFMGSGTTAVAAKRLARDFIGIEISPEYCKLAEQRISSMAIGDSLPLGLTSRRPAGRKNKNDAQLSFFKASHQPKQ